MADPVADFIAREQDMLAELEGGAPAANGIPDLGGAPPALDDFGAFEAPPPADPVSIQGGDSGVDLAAFDSVPPVPVLNGGSHTFNGSSSAASSKGPSPVPSMPRIEGEKIRAWRQQQAEVLEKKDEAEENKKAELRKTAKRELDEWYAQREAALKLAKEANLKTEAEHLAAFAAMQSDGAQWDEVAKLCADSKNVKGGRDVSRLKSLLLHLKESQKK